VLILFTLRKNLKENMQGRAECAETNEPAAPVSSGWELKMHQQMSPIITSGADRYRQRELGVAGNGIACSRGFGCQIDRARGKSANRMRRYRHASVLSSCPPSEPSDELHPQVEG
jgi:hypothetical protein